ncbi:MAG: PaaI family thioesterase [Ktedonobacterales bacterium]
MGKSGNQDVSQDASQDINHDQVANQDARQDAERVRVVRWQDPLVGWELGRRLSGIEYLRAIRRGDLPHGPIMLLLGFHFTEVDEGRVVFTLEPGEHLYNPIGVVHGGAAATLLDSAMACAIQTLAPAGVGYTTLELKVNYVRPLLTTTGPVRAEGKVIHAGKRIATAEGRVTDASGKLYAHGTTTCMYITP